MNEFFLSLLMSLSAFFGVQDKPVTSGDWQIISDWTSTDNGYVFSAFRPDLAEACTKFESESGAASEVRFPQVVHGVHQLSVKGDLIATTGDASFKTASSFYHRGAVDCRLLENKQNILWTVIVPSKYFARFKYYPQLEAKSHIDFFFDVGINACVGISLIFLSLFSLFLFSNRIEKRQVFSLSIGSILFAAYAILASADFFSIPMTMLQAHKLADVLLWTGSLLYFYYFLRIEHLGLLEFRLFVGAFAVAQGILLTAESADSIQFGTLIPFAFAAICLICILIRFLTELKTLGWNRFAIYSLISILSFIAPAVNDILHILGLFDSYMLLPLGNVFGMFFLAISVNRKIEDAYKQREYLQNEISAWAPPFILKSIADGEIQFPIKKRLTMITFDIIGSSEIHGVQYLGRNIRSHVLYAFTESVLRLGGWREGHSGDSAYAHFGLIQDVADPAEKALMCALDFKKFLNQLSVDSGVQVQCGVGLHVAESCTVDVHAVEVSIDGYSRRQKSFDSTSPDVDLVHRIEKRMHDFSGTNIGLSEEFLKALKDRPLRIQDLGLQDFKGQDHPVQVYRLEE